LSFIFYPPGFPPLREAVQHDWARWIGNESTIKSSEIFLKGVESRGGEWAEPLR
jgi:hypothetical protein